MLARRVLDLTMADLLRGIGYCLRAPRYDGIDHLSTSFGPDLVTPVLSIRSGFDALLQALQLPAGSELLVSAINVPGMFQIAAHHGLRIIPVDLDFATMAPDLAQLEAAISGRSRVLLVAHLFGGIMPVDDLVQFAHRHRLLLIEDCAQSFTGTGGYLGHACSDVVLFSFGPIKTCSALGGGLMLCRDQTRREQIEAILAAYPRRSQTWYLLRLLKYALIRLLSSRPLYGTLLRLLRSLRTDADQFLNGLARNFHPHRWVESVRWRPPAALVAQMVAKIAAFRIESLTRRMRQGAEMVCALRPDQIPGHGLRDHSYWVCPICVEAPQEFMDRARCMSLDVTQGSDHLCVPDGLTASLPVGASVAGYHGASAQAPEETAPQQPTCPGSSLPVARHILRQAVFIPNQRFLSEGCRQQIVAMAGAASPPTSGNP